jgi:5-methylcytosine-specific restriction enzyme A
MRRLQLQRQPLCALCEARGKVTAATVVDHVIPHQGSKQLFWDSNNFQSACKPCHDSLKKQIEHRGYSTEIGVDGWPTDRSHPVYGKKVKSRGGDGMKTCVGPTAARDARSLLLNRNNLRN